MKSGLTDFLTAVWDNPAAALHYEIEITRYLNQIKFIAGKSLRTFKFPRNSTLNLQKEAPFWQYVIFRIHYEKCSFLALEKELANKKIGLHFKYDGFLPYYKRIRNFSWKIALKGKSRMEQLSLTYALPTFFISRMQEQFNSLELEQLLSAVFEGHRKGRIGIIFPQIPPPLEIFHQSSCKPKQNSHPPEQLQNFLQASAEKKIIIEKDHIITNFFSCLHENKKKLAQLREFQDLSGITLEIPSVFTVTLGLIAAHDCISKLKKPIIILDYCAAPGSKNRLIYWWKNPADRLISQDLHAFRIRRLQDLVNYGRNIERNGKLMLIQQDGANPAFRTEFRADLIFLDAPCTGSGTLHTNPELKWRQSAKFLRHHVNLQLKLLKQAVAHLEKGGILVYSTCSLYPEENEGHFTPGFLAESHLTPLELPSNFQLSGQTNKHILQFLPHRQGTAGFFIGLFQKY